MSTGESSNASAKHRAGCSLICLIVAILLLATVWAYRTSFHGALVFDDIPNLVENEWVLKGHPLSALANGSARPLLYISLAVNSRLGGLNPFGYHVFNFAVHLTAGLALFGVVRRTLCTDGIPADLQAHATGLAFASALLWLIHPLQTQAVTYVVQRCESMMGMFYLLCLYCVIRGAQSRRGWLWYLAALLAAAGGTGSKEVMATAPAVILLYDRIFLSHSWREVLVRRGWVYAMLLIMAMWLIAPVVLPREAVGPVSAGFQYDKVSPWEYLRTQPGVILHYLRLVVWPARLCLDYKWPVAQTWQQVVPSGAIIVALLMLTAFGLWRYPRLGFLGAAFFLILAPTSSIMPIADLAFEHRMYLPLAPVLVLGVVGMYWIGKRFLHNSQTQRLVTSGLLTLVALTLIVRTVNRNREYQDPVSLWAGVIEQAPHNDRAWYNAGLELAKRGENDPATAYFRRALSLNDRYIEARINLAICLGKQGELQQAISQIRQAIELKPDSAKSHLNLGMFLAARGDMEQAIEAYRRAIELDPSYGRAYVNLGNLYARGDRLDEAASSYRAAIDIDATNVDAWMNLSRIWSIQGRTREAIDGFRQTLRLNPSLTHVRSSLAWLLATSKDAQARNGPEAVRLAEAITADPRDRSFANLDILAAAYAEAGRWSEALATARQALEMAREANATRVADEIEDRLRQYQQNQPYREDVSPEQTSQDGILRASTGN